MRRDSDQEALEDSTQPVFLPFSPRKLRECLHIDALLGEGAYGEVYSASYTQIDGRKVNVALKLLHTRFNERDAEQQKRLQMQSFHKEAALMQRLSHRTVAKCFGLAQLPPNFPGIHNPEVAWVMILELLQETLACQVMPINGMPSYTTEEAALWMLDIADALGYCHRMKVIHRDVKLANIMLSCPVDESIQTGETNGAGRVCCKLVDFGLHVIASSDAPHNKPFQKAPQADEMEGSKASFVQLRRRGSGQAAPRRSFSDSECERRPPDVFYNVGNDGVARSAYSTVSLSSYVHWGQNSSVVSNVSSLREHAGRPVNTTGLDLPHSPSPQHQRKPSQASRLSDMEFALGHTHKSLPSGGERCLPGTGTCSGDGVTQVTLPPRAPCRVPRGNSMPCMNPRAKAKLGGRSPEPVHWVRGSNGSGAAAADTPPDMSITTAVPEMTSWKVVTSWLMDGIDGSGSGGGADSPLVPVPPPVQTTPGLTPTTTAPKPSPKPSPLQIPDSTYKEDSEDTAPPAPVRGSNGSGAAAADTPPDMSITTAVPEMTSWKVVTSWLMDGIDGSGSGGGADSPLVPVPPPVQTTPGLTPTTTAPKPSPKPSPLQIPDSTYKEDSEDTGICQEAGEDLASRNLSSSTAASQSGHPDLILSESAVQDPVVSPMKRLSIIVDAESQSFGVDGRSVTLRALISGSGCIEEAKRVITPVQRPRGTTGSIARRGLPIEAPYLEKVNQRRGLLSGITHVFQHMRSMLEPRFAEEFIEVYDLTGQTGSLLYMAPEVFREQPYNERVDVYSFAIIMYEVFARRSVIAVLISKGWSVQNYVFQVALGFRPEYVPHIPPKAWDLIQACWNDDPVCRPPMDQVHRSLQELLDSLRVEGADKYMDAHGSPSPRRASSRAVARASGLVSASSGRERVGSVNPEKPGCGCVIC